MKILILLFLGGLVFSLPIKAQEKPLKSGIYNDPFRNRAIKPVSDIVLPVLSGSTTMLSNLEITSVHFRPGGKSTPEVYSDIEQMIIVVKGPLKVSVGGLSKTLSEGSVAYCVTGDKLMLENPNQGFAYYYLLKLKAKPAGADRKQQSQGSFIVDWNETTFKPHERGGRRDIFDRATSLFERFEMHVTTLKEGISSHDPHKHNAEEIILLKRGIAEMVIAGENMSMDTWDVAFLDSQVFHGITKNGKGEREYYAFQWEVTK